MPIIRRDSGNKVGWTTYDNEAEAREAAAKARAQGIEMAGRGYDFGYTFPGVVDQIRRDGELVDEWRVTTP